MTWPRMEFSLIVQVLSFQMKLAINAPEEKKQTSPVPSPMTATNNVMPPAVLPAGGPPAKTMGGPMILTPAQGNYKNTLHFKYKINTHYCDHWSL